jgi:hypothetical protein
MNDAEPYGPKVTKVTARTGHVLRVRFTGERHERELDLTGLLARSRHFAPLLNDEKAFAQVRIVGNGMGVEWPVRTKWGPLDLCAATLRRIADEQQPMSGADFAAWREKLGLSLAETANVLGLGRRTVMGYLKKEELPATVAIACRALERDDNLLAARYVPAKKARSAARLA